MPERPKVGVAALLAVAWAVLSLERAYGDRLSPFVLTGNENRPEQAAQSRSRGGIALSSDDPAAGSLFSLAALRRRERLLAGTAPTLSQYSRARATATPSTLWGGYRPPASRWPAGSPVKSSSASWTCATA